MTWLALQSLRTRWSRALTAIIGAGVAISIAFVLQGITTAFQSETDRTLNELGNHFLVPEGSTGLISTLTSEEMAPEGTTPIVFWRAALPIQDVDLNIFGVPEGSVEVAEGRGFSGPDEVVIDVSSTLAVGDTVTLAEREVTVVGTTEGVRIFGGGPVAFLSNEAVQDMYHNGSVVASAFSSPTLVEPTPGLKVLTQDAAKSDLDRSVKGAISTIVLTRTLLWVMVAGIVFILNRLNLADRKSELATLKCLGVNGWAIGLSLIFESIFIGVLGGIVGSAAGLAISPLFPLAIESSWLTAAQIIGLSTAVSLLSAIIGTLQLRRVTPSDAFRGET